MCEVDLPEEVQAIGRKAREDLYDLIVGRVFVGNLDSQGLDFIGDS